MTVLAARAADAPAGSNLESVPSAKLLDRAYDMLSNEELRDSALLYYSVVANRYYDKSATADDRRRALSAMDDMGYMYFFYYLDYQKAYFYMNRALKLSLKEHATTVTPFIYLNLANLFRTYSDVNNDRGFDALVIDYYRRAFHGMVKVEKWRASQVAFFGLAHQAYRRGMIDSIMPEVRLLRTAKIPAATPLLQVNRHFCDMLDRYRQRDYHGALASLRLMVQRNDAQDNPFRFEIIAVR